MGIISKFQNVLPRSALLTIYKFIRPHVDYGAIRGSSTDKIYEELGLESLKPRRWYRKMSFLYKVLKSELPSYLFNTIPNSNNRQHQRRNSGSIPSFFTKHDCFKNSFSFLQ